MPQLSAALAFYTVFSLAPLLVVAVGVAGYVFGREAAREEVIAYAQQLLGPELAAFVRNILMEVRQQSPWATVVGLGTVLLGASLAFVHLQDALNEVWGVKEKEGNSVRLYLRKRVLSFLMVLCTGVLLLLSLAASTALSLVMSFSEEYVQTPAFLYEVGNTFGSLVVTAILFAVIYKALPDVVIAWSDVWTGAAVTSVLFNTGKFLISLYLSHSGVGSAYGAAGSLFIFLVWVYYSAHVFFFGAEFTQVYARHFGSGLHPTGNATSIAG